MPNSLWSTYASMGVVKDLRTVPNGYRRRYFGGPPFYSNQQGIQWDQVFSERRLAQFQLPTVAADYTQSKGAVKSVVEPPYIREHDPVNPTMGISAQPGERPGGEMTPQQRIQAIKLKIAEDQLTRIANREEVMCVESLMYGTITAAGPKHPNQQINYGRDAALTIALSGGARWSQSGSNPINDINDWEKLFINKSGSAIVDLVFNGPAWTLFENHIMVKDYLKFINGANTPPDVKFDQPNQAGMNFKGQIKSGINMFLYLGQYENSAGTLVDIMPTAATVNVIGLPETRMGYGAIQNMHSLVATDVFLGNYEENNPSREVLTAECSPVPLVGRINATARATVD